MTLRDALAESAGRVPGDVRAVAEVVGYLLAVAVPTAAVWFAAELVEFYFHPWAGLVVLAAGLYLCIVLFADPLLRWGAELGGGARSAGATAVLVDTLVLALLVTVVLAGAPADWQCAPGGGWERAELGLHAVDDPAAICERQADSALPPSLFELQVHLEHQLGLADHTAYLSYGEYGYSREPYQSRWKTAANASVDGDDAATFVQGEWAVDSGNASDCQRGEGIPA